jgi:hypothetical protein
MMTMVISGSDGVTFPDSTTQNTTDRYGFVNRIINGDMRIDQRNNGAAVTANGAFPVDRFSVSNTSDGAFSAQQDTDAPNGFVNSTKITITTADASLTTTQALSFVHRIEGTNVSDLGWGSASAQTITLSFWVKSSLTGTFGGSLRNSAANRSYPFEYAISSANTWEQKSVTIPGDTTGTWLTTNGLGINVFFGLGVGPDRSGTAGAWNSNNNLSATGAVSVVGTNGATFYITGVQLEAGSVATPFERRPYGTELSLCQRYCQNFVAGGPYQRYGTSLNYSTTQGFVIVPVLVEMRTTPTLTTTGTSSNYAIVHGSNTVTALSANLSLDSNASSTKVVALQGTVSSGLTAGGVGQLISNNNTASYLLLTAEL